MQTETLPSILYRSRKGENGRIRLFFDGKEMPESAKKLIEENERILRGLEEKFGCGKGKG